jgi:hypothetical protein
VGHQEAGATVTARRAPAARGHALFAVATAAVVAVSIFWLARIGPRVPAPIAPGVAPSGAWICPHGGGEDVTVSTYLANPGTTDVTARLTRLGASPAASESVAVPAGTTVRVASEPPDRGSATFVEYFGGWIGAGWVASTREGLAAEPCADRAARGWYLPDGTTQLGEEAYAIVANPFASPAVLDVVLYSADRAPIRSSEWTGLVIPPRRSAALRVNSKVEGEPVVAVALDVTVGRVAAASLGVSDRTKLRSALGWTHPTAGGVFPVVRASGQTELLLLSTADRSIRFGATELTEEPPRPAGGLTEQEHGPAAARAYAIPLAGGPSAIRVFTLEGEEVVGAVRARGPGEDLGATGGATSSAETWLLLPALARSSSVPDAVVVNDGDDDVVASVELLPKRGASATSAITVTVPAHSAVAVPASLWRAAPDSALVVRSDGGPIVALAASTDARGGAFALALGVPIPRTP